MHSLHEPCKNNIWDMTQIPEWPPGVLEVIILLRLFAHTFPEY